MVVFVLNITNYSVKPLYETSVSTISKTEVVLCLLEKYFAFLNKEKLSNINEWFSHCN